MSSGYSVRSPHPHERLLRDTAWLGRHNRMVHGLLELDVTEPRRAIATREEGTDDRLSFTAFLATCLAEAIGRHPTMQAYRNWRGDHVLFDDVDVMVMIETGDDDRRVPVAHVLRAANDRSVVALHREIRSVQRGASEPGDRRLVDLFTKLPGPVRRLGYRLVRARPQLWKRFGGTVALTAVGMFGEGGGWAIPIANHSLGLTVGGIAERPRAIDGEVEIREVLDVTISVDHSIVEGAPATRFAGTFRELVEGGYGLE